MRASNSSLKIFLIEGRNIFIATSFLTPLFFIFAKCTCAIEAAAIGSLNSWMF